MKSKAKARLRRITQKEIRGLVYQRLYEIDSPRSLAIFLIMSNTDKGLGTDDEVLNLELRPEMFNSSKAFEEFAEPLDLVRKSEFLILETDPEQVALEKWNEAEVQCALTNRRFSGDDNDHEPRMLKYLQRARYALSSMLGKVDSNVLSFLVSNGGWGKGVTSSCKGGWLTEYHKLKARPEATQSMLALAHAIKHDVSPSGLWTGEVTQVTGSKLTFVPKDARTHRAIAIEPSMNLFLQKGIGTYLKKRMHRRWNLDLRSQERNQKLALEGSLYGSHCTIDLSSASDTIARRVVEQLLPDDWVRLLACCRSTFTTLPSGEVHLLAKWSSMGNGYTFELETAIFSALVFSVIPSADWYSGNWAVFGDDIIVDNSYYQEICDLLEYCGFSINKKKSFASTPFRESCGADFFYGDPVRQFYLKKVDWVSLVVWHQWLTSKEGSDRSRMAIHWTLGPSFPVVPIGEDGLIGLCESEAEPRLARRRKRTFGYATIGLRWAPRTLKPSRVEDDEVVLAHLRVLKGTDFTNPRRPWLLTMSGAGEWVRSIFYTK